MKRLLTTMAALLLALVMLLALTGCGSNAKLIGSWYQEGTGKLMFTLYKNGECDLCTSGVSSAGQWSVSDGTLRMTTIINNENYTIESLKGGCLTVTGKRGETLVLWSTEEAALMNSGNETVEEPATADKESISVPDTAAVPKESDKEVPVLEEPISTPESTAASEPTPEPVRYYTVTEAQDDLFFTEDENGRMLALHADGNTVFQLPKGRTFEYEPFFKGEYAVISNEGIIDHQGNILIELTDTDYNWADYSFLEDGFVICGKELNTFDFTGTRYYACNIETQAVLECPEDSLGITHYSTEDYLGNGYFKYYSDDSVCIFNALSGESVNIMVEWGSDAAHVFDRIAGLTSYGYYVEESILRNGFDWFDLETGSHATNDYPEALAGMVDPFWGVDGWGATPIGNGVYLYSNHEDRALCNLAEGTAVSISEYTAFDVLRMLNDGGILAVVKNDGGGRFITVIEPDGTRRFEPIALGDYSYSESCFEVWDDSADIIYDYNGNVIARVDNAATTLGDNSVLCRDKATGALNVIELATGKTVATGVKAKDSSVLYASGAYAVTPDGIDGSYLIQEDGTVLALIMGGVMEPQEIDASAEKPDHPLDVTFEIMDDSILVESRDTLIERYYELPRVSEDTAMGRKLNDVFYEEYVQKMESQQDYFDMLVEMLTEEGFDFGDSRLYENITCEVVMNEDGILAVQYCDDAYTGGTHGWNEIYGMAVDVNTGERIALSDFNTPEGEPMTMEWIKNLIQQYVDSNNIESQGLDDFDEYYTLDTLCWTVRDGEVYICIWKYQVASAAYGSFEVPTGIMLGSKR